MDRARELEELEQIDVHIDTCVQRIAEQKLRLTSIKESGLDVEDSEALLQNLVGSLGALQHLRKLVVRTLKELETLPPCR
jgi:hypothetical protein